MTMSTDRTDNRGSSKNLALILVSATQRLKPHLVTTACAVGIGVLVGGRLAVGP